LSNELERWGFKDDNFPSGWFLLGTTLPFSDLPYTATHDCSLATALDHTQKVESLREEGHSEDAHVLRTLALTCTNSEMLTLAAP
jgi:hypothetical protein